MPKRTYTTDLQTWDDAQDLEHIVKDKRAQKRATDEKARRRNRRYEKRLLNAQLKNAKLDAQHNLNSQ
ncbi:MAG: hypothetical protein ACUVRP_04255 [Chlorobiales bacterium]|jgi:hypothetical protein